MRRFTSATPRRGAAAVELACVLPLLVILIVGVWEIGRLIQLQQIMNAAARDGARLAAQANIISANGETTQIAMQTSNPNVEDTIRGSLQAAGISNLNGLQIAFEFLEGDLSAKEPYQGVKNQRFRLRVTLPYANLRWTNLGLINPTTLGGECTWQMLVDDPFTLSTTMPGWSP
jgi:hypothetical protein